MLMPAARVENKRDGYAGSTYTWTASKVLRISDNPGLHTTQAYVRSLHDFKKQTVARISKEIGVSVVIPWGSRFGGGCT